MPGPELQAPGTMCELDRRSFERALYATNPSTLLPQTACPETCEGLVTEERPYKMLGLIPAVREVLVCPLSGKEQRVGIIEHLAR